MQGKTHRYRVTDTVYVFRHDYGENCYNIVVMTLKEMEHCIRYCIILNNIQFNLKILDFYTKPTGYLQANKYDRTENSIKIMLVGSKRIFCRSGS